MSNALPVPARANQRNNRNVNIVVSQNNGLPASINQGNNIVQNINQNTVSNNVAQQIVQQSSNNSANVGDGLPNVPNQNNSNNDETMSDWFISRMSGENRDQWGNINTDGAIHNGPVDDLIGVSWQPEPRGPIGDGTSAWRLARIREDVPNYGRHGRSEFEGDWVRWTRTTTPGYFFRPTSNSNYR